LPHDWKTSKRKEIVSDLAEKGKYVALKRRPEDRKQWQKLLRAGSHKSCACFSGDYLKKKMV